ncbi:YibE/F family protein [Candidatus Bathyarchaeota archaeon]|nr:YibE/F family protein [Candidatus Bathyarchaeota archaeon]
MPNLDIAMPIALFATIMVALYLNRRVEGKLMATVEKKEFKARDIVLLAAFIVIMITAISYTAIFNPGGITESVLLVLFLSSYTMLLFTFSYVFSNTSRKRAQVISAGFGVASLAFGFAGLTAPLSDAYTTLRIAVFFALAICCFGIAAYMQKKPVVQKKGRWYLAAQPPALFLSLIIFFNILYGGAVEIWQPYLMDVFGFTFAVLIILYLSSLFNWKTVGIFAALLTVIDIILVIGTGTMVTAAKQFTGLGLPVLVYLPNFPLIYNMEGLIQYRGLGLGDFFFAGILLVQTYKKFGKKTALAAASAMAVAFGIWEAYLSEVLAALEPIVGREIGGFPGTLMIICGWVPVVAVAWLLQKKNSAPSIKPAAVETESSPNPQ